MRDLKEGIDMTTVRTDGIKYCKARADMKLDSTWASTRGSIKLVVRALADHHAGLSTTSAHPKRRSKHRQVAASSARTPIEEVRNSMKLFSSSYLRLTLE